MWTVSITSTKFANEKLASLSVESPANLHTHEGLGLLVGLWCGRLHDRIPIEDGMLEFAVGFQVGDVIVEPKGAQISNRGRLQTTGGHIKVATSETDQSKKHGSTGGQLGINLSKWIGSFAKADINLGGQLDRTISQSEQKNREFVQKFWRVADAGHNFWRVYGLDLNQDNVLEHKIIGDEALCHILPEPKSSSIDIVVTFKCSLKHLWFQRTSAIPARVDIRFDQKQSEINRAAVAARIAALAISRTTSIDGADVPDEGDVVLAMQSLRFVKKREDHKDE
jgi:hypothetical protein